MSLSQDQIDDVLWDARAGEIEELQKFFDQNGVKVLPQIKDEYSLSTPLHMSSANGHLEILKYLIDLCDPEALKSIIDVQNEAGNTALHWACQNGHLDVVKVLCDAGAQPFIQNEAKHDAFYEADNKEEIIDYLLQRFSIEPEQDEDVSEQVAAMGVNEENNNNDDEESNEATTTNEQSTSTGNS